MESSEARYTFFIIRPGSTFDKSMTSLTKELMHVTKGELDTTAPTIPNVASELVSRPGRAFKHLLTGKFLAESGYTV